MMLFWRHGYEAVGTRAIEEETGLTRFTLQTTYGGKKALFLKALDQYLDQMEALLVPSMAADGVAGLARFFEAFPVPEAMREASCHGCFMVNSIAEFEKTDAAVNERAARFFGMMRDGIRRALQAAEPSLDKDEAAEVLLGTLVAMNIARKSPAIDDAALGRATAQLIRSWSD